MLLIIQKSVFYSNYVLESVKISLFKQPSLATFRNNIVSVSNYLEKNG